MSIFKNIFNPVSSRSEDRQTAKNETESRPRDNNPRQAVVLGDNVVEVRERLAQAIVDALLPLRGMDKMKDMTLFVADPTLFVVADDSRFRQLMQEQLDNHLLHSLACGKLTVLSGTAESADAITVIDHVLQLVLAAVGNQATALATLSVVGRMGSMKESTCLLDSSKKQIFHIGRGEMVKRDGKYRVNDVVVNDEEPHADLLAMNRKVSSSQADILWREGAFYIKAMASGCRAEGGSPTKVIRDETAMELRDIYTLIPLQDGDYIELGGAVMLRFDLTGGKG